MIRTSNIPHDLLDITKQATEFYIKTFVHKRSAKRIQEIKIGFKNFTGQEDVDAAEDIAWATYEDDDRGRLPSEFVIAFNNKYRDIPIRDYLCILFHELTHMNQYLSGRLKARHLINVWEGEKIDPSKVDYWDHPWEREAIAMETVAYAKFDTAFPHLGLRQWKPTYLGRAASGWVPHQKPVSEKPSEINDLRSQ